MRRQLALAAAVLALSPIALALALGREQPLRATPLPLDADDPARVRVGALRYFGGWQLSSGERQFGGISSLIADHGRFIAIGDSGNIMRFQFDRAGRISGAPVFELADGPGTDNRKSKRDSESSTRDPVTGKIWIGFEGANQLWRYSPDLAHGEAHVRPHEMVHWPANTGAEALVRLRDGRFLVFSEEAELPNGANAGLLFASDPTVGHVKPLCFGYRAPPGYAVTDAAELPDGRLLMLHRRFTLLDGVSAKLAIVDLRGIAAGATIAGKEIATLAPPLTVDNMEGLAVERDQGRTIVWIASDDNFSAVQRTLLLKFALEDER